MGTQPDDDAHKQQDTRLLFALINAHKQLTPTTQTRLVFG
jgi:hypothetical protein